MKIYFAPMEGITTYIYRNAHAEMFSGCDEYFAPFITPSEKERVSSKNFRDIVKENNIKTPKIQVLCIDQKPFFEFEKRAKELGYDEVNLNFGCPSGTVVKKGRGAGALKDIRRLEKFLDEIFSASEMKISIKTRTGFYEHEEFRYILGIYNKYPLSELIIHPRVREEYYKDFPNMDSFDFAYQNSSSPLCYNGNIYTVEDYEKITEKYPRINSVMIGRGAIKNPALFREIAGGEKLKTEELVAFSNILEERYLEWLKSETYTIHKLKEIWIHQMKNYPEENKILKAIKKSNKLCELNSAINSLPKL